jgi:hypothetical protein
LASSAPEPDDDDVQKLDEALALPSYLRYSENGRVPVSLLPLGFEGRQSASPSLAHTSGASLYSFSSVRITASVLSDAARKQRRKKRKSQLLSL